MAGRPRVYAHRLGADYGPESSRAALRSSLERGVDGVEADVLLTADGEVVALHDPVLSMSTDSAGWADKVEAAELRRARLRDETGAASEEHPLTLGEVLEEIPVELPVQLDVKAYADHELARRTAELACELAVGHGTADRVEVISFFTEACIAATELGIAARLVAWSDYAPDAMARWVSERGFVGVAIEGFIVDERIVTPLREAGLTISVGAVNTVEQLRRLLPVQPDIVVSNRPAELAAALEGLMEPT
jgi:glycerophosphoryl diester phosphodiesterase